MKVGDVLRGQRRIDQASFGLRATAGFDGFLYSLDAVTGAERWRIRPIGGAFPIASLATDGKRFFVTCSSNRSVTAVGDATWRWVP